MNMIVFAAGAICVAAAFAIPCSASTENYAALGNATPAHDITARSSPALDKSKARKPGPPLVSEASARRIAWRSGLDHIEEVVLLDEHWEVAGRDRTGNEKTLAIDADDGRVLN